MTTRPAIPLDKACAACGTPFACGPGIGATPGACWCQDMPRLPVIDPAQDCFCPACLAARLAAPADPA